jgi:hypothetical protein
VKHRTAGRLAWSIGLVGLALTAGGLAFGAKNGVSPWSYADASALLLAGALRHVRQIVPPITVPRHPVCRCLQYVYFREPSGGRPAPKPLVEPCAPGGTRTPNLLIRSQTLYPD